MEGQFSRGYKGPGHPHTNMAKAALNMLTRTSAKELLSDGILMTSVDTGWITDERPHPTKMRLADEGFHAPLDLVDGAARVYDPIVRGEAGEDVHGVFLKDYAAGGVVIYGPKWFGLMSGRGSSRGGSAFPRSSVRSGFGGGVKPGILSLNLRPSLVVSSGALDSSGSPGIGVMDPGYSR